MNQNQNQISNCSSAGLVADLPLSAAEVLSSHFLVMSHVDAYMFTLLMVDVRLVYSTHTQGEWVGDCGVDEEEEEEEETNLSIQLPGIRAATRWVENPRFSNTDIYHGFSPAERSRTRPPSFKAWFKAST